jgi:hypothetical protein
MKTTEQKLNEMFEAFKKEVLKEFSEENEFEVGKWYKYKYNDDNIVFKKDESRGYGVWNNIWDDNLSISSHAIWTPATDKEVEEALEKESIKKGYNNPGVQINSLKHPGQPWFVKGGKQGLYNDGYWFMGNIVMKDGKWAEIVEDKIMIGGHEIVLNNDRRIKVGCKIFLKSEIRDIKDIMINNKFKTVAFDGIETDLETIEKILKL